MSRTKHQDVAVRNVGIESETHREMRAFAKSRGLKMYAIIPKLWRSFVSLPNDQQIAVLFNEDRQGDDRKPAA